MANLLWIFLNVIIILNQGLKQSTVQCNMILLC